MARPKKHPATLQGHAVKVYLTEEQYESFKDGSEQRGMTLSGFLTYRPDLQENTLAYLKRIHDLTREIHVTYAAVTGKAPVTKDLSTKNHVSAAVAVTSATSDANWEKYKAQKAAGDTLPEGDINPQVALLAELRQKFAEMKQPE